MPSPDTSA